MCFNIPLPKTGPEDETSALVFVVCCDAYYNVIQVSCLLTGMYSLTLLQMNRKASH